MGKEKKLVFFLTSVKKRIFLNGADKMKANEAEERKKTWNKILKELDQGFEKPFLTLTDYLKNTSTNKEDMYLVHKGAVALLLISLRNMEHSAESAANILTNLINATKNLD